MSLLKKLSNSWLGLKGNSPTSYTTKLFNEKTKNSNIVIESRPGRGATPTPLYTQITTENSEVMLTEDNFELILE